VDDFVGHAEDEFPGLELPSVHATAALFLEFVKVPQPGNVGEAFGNRYRDSRRALLVMREESAPESQIQRGLTDLIVIDAWVESNFSRSDSGVHVG
jgi:hypothetical protein